MVISWRTVLPILLVSSCISAAPTTDNTADLEQTRQQKSIPFYEYYQPEEIDYNIYDPEAEDYIGVDLEENELSRTVPSRKRYNNRPQQFNSPIYYIRLPPQPYMFIPGLGYVSQPSTNPMNQFLNVPVSFLANGKPSTIYQWTGAIDQFPGVVSNPPAPVLPAKPKPQPPKHTDSTIHRVPGQFVFNGKPDDIYVLRDSYNSLYSDALQNFYP